MRESNLFDSLLFTAINACLEAGRQIYEVYHRPDFNIQIKEDQSPLTDADSAGHHAIMRFLKKTPYPVLSEEGNVVAFEVRRHWRMFWLVDPLDGTKEFISRNGEFTVNIALIENNRPVLGVIYLPVTGELYFGHRALGAYKMHIEPAENHPSSLKELISLSHKLPTTALPDTFTVVGSRSHLSPETAQYIDQLKSKQGELAFISKGSSLKLCMIAEQKAHLYPRFGPTREWDIAAGHAIISSCGGTVKKSDCDEELQYNKEDLLNPWFIAQI